MPEAVCLTCTHPQRDEIDRALAAGEPSLSVLSARYGPSKAALHRHKQRHLPNALVEVVAPGDPESALARVEALMDRVERTLSKAERSGKPSQSVAAARELRLCIELLARLSGELRPDPAVQVNLIASPEWISLRGSIMGALGLYPDARLAVAEALELEAGA
jgi:hypothetical protein